MRGLGRKGELWRREVGREGKGKEREGVEVKRERKVMKCERSGKKGSVIREESRKRRKEKGRE